MAFITYVPSQPSSYRFVVYIDEGIPNVIRLAFIRGGEREVNCGRSYDYLNLEGENLSPVLLLEVYQSLLDLVLFLSSFCW